MRRNFSNNLNIQYDTQSIKDYFFFVSPMSYNEIDSECIVMLCVYPTMLWEATMKYADISGFDGALLNL